MTRIKERMVALKWKIRDNCVAVALVSLALAAYRHPLTWQALDYGHSPEAASARFLCLCFGLIGVAVIGRTPAGRLLWLALALLVMQSIAFLHHEAGIAFDNDLPGVFNVVTLFAAMATGVAGFVLRENESKDLRQSLGSNDAIIKQ